MAKKSSKKKLEQISKVQQERKNLYNRRYRLRKKLEQTPKRKQAAIKKEIQVVTNEIIGKGRSITRLKSPAISTTVLRKPRRVAQPKEGAPKIKKVKAEQIRKERQSLYNRRYRLKKKLEEATTQKERDKINRQILGVAAKVSDLNEELGLAPAAVEVPEDKITITDGVQEEILAVWEARQRLTELLRGGFFKRYRLGFEEYAASKVPFIMDAFSDLEDAAYRSGTKTPYVVFTLEFTEKRVTVDIQ